MADGNFISIAWLGANQPDWTAMEAGATPSKAGGNWRTCLFGGSAQPNGVCFLVGSVYYLAYMYERRTMRCSRGNEGNTQVIPVTQWGGNVFYGQTPGSYHDAFIPAGNYISWDSLDDALNAYADYTLPDIPVTYIPTNCTLSGPATVKASKQVTVTVSFDTGYGFSNLNDIYVTYNGASITSTYDSNTGILTFTAPNP